MGRGRRRAVRDDDGGEVRAVPADVPPPAVVPEWSEKTRAAFAELDPVERAFVEHVSMGCSAAEAYRRATGAEYTDRETDTTRINGHYLRSRPRVSRAIELAMTDAAFGHAMSREWMLQKLYAAVEKAEQSKSYGAAQVIGELVERIAKLKGEYLPERQEVLVRHDVTPAGKRFLEALELAKRKAGIVVVTQAEPLADLAPVRAADETVGAAND